VIVFAYHINLYYGE